MQRARALIRSYRHLALLALLLALCVKALIPSGFMVSASPDRVLTVAICADATGELKQLKIVIPGKAQDSSHAGGANMDGFCAFACLAHTAIAGASAILLALAFAIILMLGLRPAARLDLAQLGYLRPPLRGPPQAA
jgi:hypothetical protein